MEVAPVTLKMIMTILLGGAPNLLHDPGPPPIVCNELGRWVPFLMPAAPGPDYWICAEMGPMRKSKRASKASEKKRSDQR